ncbi:MAG TPA: 30S ribosomal protein S6 [Candidatus Sulfotelmatobacter sp.]|jgi:ribosomal protein S6|nr:30S ribosomal protein S6 [Candidatus Sulfotelmatobacter sp.]
MRTYELVLVVKPSVKEADRKKLLEQVKGWLGEVKVVKEEEWGQKALAYPIKKEDAGYYFQWYLEGETFPADFETRLIQNNDILRHLLLRMK